MKNRNSLLLLFTANAISGFAQGVSMLAIPWYFTSKAESGYFNIAYGLITLFVMFFGLYAGTLIDRYSRKSNFLVVNLVCGLLLLGIASSGYLYGPLPNIMVIAVFAMTMLNYNIHYPALYAFGQEILRPDQYQRFNSSIEIVGQSTSILSGGFAALLLQGIPGSGKLFGFHVSLPFTFPKWEIHDVFMMDAVTYFAAVVLIALIPYQPNPHLYKQTGSIAERIRKGFSYLKSRPELMLFGFFSYSVFAMLMVELHAVLPGYIERHLHEDGSVFAVADGIYAMGALCAGLFVSRVFSSTGTVRAVILLTLATTGIFLWTFASGTVLVIYIIHLVLGFANAGIRVLRLTYLFKHVPNELMGRVNSIFNMANVLIRSLFIFLFSFPFFTFGNQIRWAWLIMAVFLLISGLVLLMNYKRTDNTGSVL